MALPNKSLSHRTRSHEKVLQQMCLLCLGKGSLRITDKYKSAIQAHILSDYTTHEKILPQSLCTSCQRKLSSLTTASPQNIPPLDYQNMIQDLQNRDNSTLTTFCTCGACAYALWKPPHPKAKRPQSRYHFPLAVSPPPPAVSLPQSPPPPKTSPPHHASLPQAQEGVVCDKCFGPVVPDTDHDCSRTARLQNVDKLLTPRSKQQLASSIIREAVEASGSNTVSLMNAHGRPTEVSATPTNTKAK